MSSTPHLGQPTAPTSSTLPSTSNPIPPGTFVSVIPYLEEILGNIIELSTLPAGSEKEVEKNREMMEKAREMTSKLKEMKIFARDLPGGGMSLTQIKDLIAVLEGEAESRRRVLSAFGDLKFASIEGIPVDEKMNTDP